jgi:hypothetical protein
MKTKVIKVISFLVLFSLPLTVPAGPVPGKSPAIEDLEEEISILKDRVAALEKILRYVTVERGTIRGLLGPNVHIRNGHIKEETDTINGVGNLVLGYNEEPPELGVEERLASHDLIIGRYHRYTSFGGLVAGNRNWISGEEATVSGGQENIASGDQASVSGGLLNTANAPTASVSGGETNTAGCTTSSPVECGDSTSVSGGAGNVASGDYASISGGAGNSAKANYSRISGGRSNFTDGSMSSVSGGGQN